MFCKLGLCLVLGLELELDFFTEFFIENND